jgi:hypothetical protein
MRQNRGGGVQELQEYRSCRRSVRFWRVEFRRQGAGGRSSGFQPISAKIIVRRFDGGMVFVPEGQHDSSQARFGADSRRTWWPLQGQIGWVEIPQGKPHARQHKAVSFWKKFGRRLES